MVAKHTPRAGIVDLLVTLTFLLVVAYPATLSLFVSDSSHRGHADVDLTRVGGWTLVALAVVLPAAYAVRARHRRPGSTPSEHG
jgi:hypothetical protein